ncbi:MAG: hypoxanthine phosphoribosyltransferase [Candidatus Borkfalkiaceae bacterium]|nr:hypoxanthine phosphoribosyltransferase [Christensenellaceae bacterium]
MYNDLEKILITREELALRVKELAKTLDEDYKGKNPIVVCILKGSTLFFADLVREMKIPVEFDFLSISSYGNKTKSSGEVKMIKDLDNLIENRHVLLIEDIVDSGYTLTYLKKLLSSRRPASIKICTLLDKKSRREVPLEPDYCGFEIDDYFVVGYGLDYAQKYRNLPEIGVLKPEVYTK